ncbi:MAG: nuclear transport factor 2 family protein [Sphingobacteriia bacterium]|nr:nuclear transport factor 2 family protein [Sphingobacteriia bacterium]
MSGKDTMPDFRQAKNVELAKSLLKRYKTAIESLDVTGTERFFTTDSRIYESGSSEGTYIHYLEYHLAPELKGFKSFTFSDYMAEVQIDGNYAFATETYNYTVVTTKENTEIKRIGITTSVLKKIKGEWKIMMSHSSSRK